MTKDEMAILLITQKLDNNFTHEQILTLTRDLLQLVYNDDTEKILNFLDKSKK